MAAVIPQAHDRFIQIVFVAEVNADAGSLVAGGGGGDSAERIDRRSDPCVSGTKNPAVIFNGTHTNHIEVLPGGAGVAVPAIVGDVDQDIGSLLRELADENAYARHLAAHGRTHSAAEWREFCEERLNSKYARAKCWQV